MAELVTVARPYAEASFKAALEGNALGPVSDGLQMVAAIANDAQMRSVVTNPRVNSQQKKELFAAVAGTGLHANVTNLVAMLVDNHREVLLPLISSQFEELKRDHERVLHAKITSAQPLTDAQRSELVASLERQYGRKVEAEVDVDPELLGGARVQVGDQVIHASVRDALAQMAAALAR
ncbi:F0F1 ATP synthase subunit delta [Usitatibacter palustris]|uniref:ATP synthase subunit delta n=1 Tax=Usitatibacter palustris TaxID=2732487 RepID=A0A6M4HCJ7_9PROT|nr:F0F1 ATP synthase subunit delta [Usitatibacter palustris]QJR16962.1 ATP synthase subunit delta [Usitatibacter palustris]